MGKLSIPQKILREAARLLEMEKWLDSPVFQRRADCLYQRLSEVTAGRGRMITLPVSVGGDALDFGAFRIKSRDLCRIFAHCRSCALMAVTLGPGVDRLMDRVQKEDMADAVLLDSIASAEAENLCDVTERSLGLKLPEGQYPTMRFSPGYGDVPLMASGYILSVLGVRGDMGISMTDSYMLVPVKSITAFIGISDRPEPRGRSCDGCAMADRCSYKKKGEICGVQN